MDLNRLKALLEGEAKERNRCDEISLARPDPLLVAQKTKSDLGALICALFSYGNAKQIVAFLETLDFSLLAQTPQSIQDTPFGVYRFQNSEDVRQLFLALSSLSDSPHALRSIFLEGHQRGGILEGIKAMQRAILEHSGGYQSSGFRFLIGNPETHQSPLKRWNMFLRWMIRKDCLDLGWWEGVILKSELILPLDTHTFALCKKLKIIQRQSYDLKAAIEATEFLKKLDPHDPIKYDFALYRLGQERRELGD